MSTLDEITQEKQRVSEALVRIDAQRQKLAGQLGELEATERVLARYSTGTKRTVSAKSPPSPTKAVAPAQRQRGRRPATTAKPGDGRRTSATLSDQCLPWQPAERSTKSLPLVRGLARTMSARRSPGTSGQAASKSATGSYTQAKRQRRRNTQRSDSAVIGRSRSSVTADRKVELTAAVSLAATTGGLCFLADDGQ